MSDRFLERRINIKFCVRSGKNANDSEANGVEATKASGVSE